MRFVEIEFLLKDSPEILTIHEAAALTRSSESYLRHLIQTDRLPCFKVGRNYRVIKWDVVQCFVEKPVPSIPVEHPKPVFKRLVK